MSNLIVNSSHGPGATCLAFSKDGSHAYTGGQDCIVRIWKIELGAEQEPDTAGDSDEPITSVATASDCWISASEDAKVRRYAKHRNELAGHVASASGVAVRSVALDNKGKRVAVASDELEIKVVDMEDIVKVHMLSGHGRGVRKVTWHPMGSLLTSCGGDGNIIVWDVSGDTPDMLKTIQGIIPAVHDSQSAEFLHDCSAIWHPSGDYLFVASRGHEVVTISKDTWAKSSSYSDPKSTGAVTALAVSVNGLYLASAAGSQVHVWSTQTRRLLFSRAGAPDATITQLAFSPTKNLLAWTDADGALSRWHNPVPGSFPDPVKVTTASSASATIPIQRKPASDFLFGDEPVDTAETDVPDVDLDDMDDDWIIDDLKGAMQDDKPEVRSKQDGFVKEMVSITKAQPPFQPGSTPMQNKKRYLAYNMIGVIEVTDQDTHHIVNVEFFDRSVRKGYHFTDHFKYDLGYLGERGALLACQPDSDHPAQVLYKPYGTWTSQPEWSYVLTRKGSKVLGVAAGGSALSTSRHASDADFAGSGDVVIATSEGDLSFLSGTGRERRIIALGGEYVSMVAGDGWVFVVHRAGSTTIDGSQNLAYSLIDFEDFGVRQRDILPVPKGHVLKWIGVTQEGAPTMFDSTGCIHVLSKFRVPHHASWVRVLDTNLLERRQGKDESYWPVGILGSTFMCLILKGRQEFPSFPRPLIQELPIRMPFRKEEEADEKVERELFLLEMARDDLGEELTTDDIAQRELTMDKEFIQLIQAACKTDNIPRAIELTKLLHHTVSFDMTAKLAGFYHLVGFQEKVERLKQDRETEDRLAIARDKRQDWAKAPPVRHMPSSASASSSSHRPFSDFGPPPAVHRPGLARATPQPQYSSSSYASTSSSFNDFPESTPSPGDGKRKRDLEDDVLAEDTPKRRAVAEQETFSMPPPKQKANPFARKAGQDTKQNPFARKAESSKPLQKSESFFEKVDAAETSTKKRIAGKTKEKEKPKKDLGPRQTTLFGLPAVEDKGKKPRVSGKKKGTEILKDTDESLVAETIESQSQDEAEQTQIEEAQTAESQAEESQAGESQVIDTEESQETQRGSWELSSSETQVVPESQLIDCKY